jgi:hypothetical protein
MNPIYSTEQTLAPLILYLISIPLVALLILALLLGTAPLEWFILLAVSALFGMMLLFFNKMKVQVFSDSLSVGFRIYSRKIKFDEIVKLYPSERISWNQIGIKIDLAGNWTFTARPGKGVKIELKKGRNLTFSAASPEEIIRVIEPLLPK